MQRSAKKTFETAQLLACAFPVMNCADNERLAEAQSLSTSKDRPAGQQSGRIFGRCSRHTHPAITQGYIHARLNLVGSSPSIAHVSPERITPRVPDRCHDGTADASSAHHRSRKLISTPPPPHSPCMRPPRRPARIRFSRKKKRGQCRHLSQPLFTIVPFCRSDP